jgi:hypothetical protein
MFDRCSIGKGQDGLPQLVRRGPEFRDEFMSDLRMALALQLSLLMVDLGPKAVVDTADALHVGASCDRRQLQDISLGSVAGGSCNRNFLVRRPESLA